MEIRRRGIVEHVAHDRSLRTIKIRVGNGLFDTYTSKTGTAYIDGRPVRKGMCVIKGDRIEFKEL